MRYLRIFVSVLIFAFVMLFFSPWYARRSVEIAFSCSCDAETEIAVAADYSGDLFNREKLLFAKLVLPPGAERKVRLRLPTVEAAARGIRIDVPEGKCITIRGLSVKGRGKRYPVNWQEDAVVRENLRIEGDAVTATGTVSVMFPKKIRIRYGIDGVMLAVALVAAAAAAGLFFLRVKVAASCQVLFIAAVMALMLFPVMMLDVHCVVSDENRFFQKFPKLSRAFPKEFEAYLGDRFFCRKKMIGWNNRLFDLTLFNSGDLNGNGKAFYGKEGWIFATAYDAVGMAQNRNRFTEKELEECAKHLDALADAFARRYGAPVFVVLMPDKERVYGEYYPDFLLRQRRHRESRLEQLTAYLREHSKVTVIAPLATLLEKKKEAPMFYPGGTHQTWRAGYHTAVMVREKLAEKFPELKGFPENIARWEMHRSADLDIATAMGIAEPEKNLDDKYLVFSEPVFEPKREAHNVRDMPQASLFINRYVSRDKAHRGIRILTVSDSFWGRIGSFMAPVASEELHVFYGNGRDFLFEPFARELEKFRPQAVIIESTERFLHRFLTIDLRE